MLVPMPAFLAPVFVGLPAGHVVEDVSEPLPPAQIATPVVLGELKEIAYCEEAVPLPQELIPLTVRDPGVAFDAKSIFILFVVPFIVAPVPEYSHR